MAVIGFLNYADFLAELKSIALYGQPIRVQHYHKGKTVQQGMIRYYTFFVEAAVQFVNVEITDILVCRFITGKTGILGDHDRGKLPELDARNRRAAEILRQALEAEGFRCARGLFAAAGSQTEADPGDLWTAEDLEKEADNDHQD